MNTTPNTAEIGMITFRLSIMRPVSGVIEKPVTSAMTGASNSRSWQVMLTVALVPSACRTVGLRKRSCLRGTALHDSREASASVAMTLPFSSGKNMMSIGGDPRLVMEVCADCMSCT